MKERNRLRLGIPLDLLLDRVCELRHHEKKGGVPGGIILPTENRVGTGNIIIRGRPGTGKSLLALQMAVKCCQLNPGYFSCFISLEEESEHIVGKTENFGWGSYLRIMRSLNCLNEFASPQEYGEGLERVLTQPIDCPIHGNGVCKGEDSHNKNICPSPVLLSSLSPRDLSMEKTDNIHVYSERYKQLENLLVGAKWLRENKNKDKYKDLPELRLICIDSLNVFGNHLLTREQIYRLFDLFHRHQVIGVFVLEEDETQVMNMENMLHSDTIEYLADVVISLQADEDEGYFVRYFEIVKSRFQANVYGKHPYKITRLGRHNKSEDTKDDLLVLETERKTFEQGDDAYEDRIKKIANSPVKEGIVIYPSLHYIVYGTEPK